MKFNQPQKQNQRIERISTSHLVVGIDMAKETHVAQATNNRRFLREALESIRGPTRFVIEVNIYQMPVNFYDIRERPQDI